MRLTDSGLQNVGATFAVHYHTTLVEAPEKMAALYTPTATVVHCSHKASGAADITSLLTTVTAANVKAVKLEDVSTTRTTSGGIKVTISGEFIGRASPQPFTQEVEMRELESNVFGLTSDKLSYTATNAATWAADEAPKTAAAEEPITEAVELVNEKKEAPCKSTPAPATTTNTTNSNNTTIAAAFNTEPAPAAATEEPAKKPTSFAEALKIKKMGKGATFSNKAVRVVASDKVDGASAAAEKAEKVAENNKHRSKKNDQTITTAAKPRAAEKATTATSASEAAAVVYYDVILKELAPTVTEDDVRAMVTPVAAVKLVNVVTSEKRRRRKEVESGAAAAAAPVITFAFVQLDKPADAPASYVKTVVEKLSEQHKDLQVEEVREKKALAYGGGSADGAARRLTKGTHGRKPVEHRDKSASMPAKPQPKKRE